MISLIAATLGIDLKMEIEMWILNMYINRDINAYLRVGEENI